MSAANCTISEEASIAVDSMLNGIRMEIGNSDEHPVRGADEASYMNGYYKGLPERPLFYHYHFSGKWQALAEEVLRRRSWSEPTKVLDIGCGPGTQVMLAASLGAESIGIDLDPKAIEIARRRADRDPRRFIGGHPSFHVLDAMKVRTLKEGPWDVIFTQQAMAQFEDQGAFLQECVACLAPGGTLLVSEGNPRHPAVFSAYVARRLRGKRAPISLNLSHAGRALRKAGCASVTVHGFAHVPPRIVESHARVAQACETMQQKWGGLPVIRSLGLTYLMVGTRVDSTAQ